MASVYRPARARPLSVSVPHHLAAPVRYLVHEVDQAVGTVKRRISASIEEMLIRASRAHCSPRWRVAAHARTVTWTSC